MPYVPPNGSAVDLEFGGSYTPPRGASINLEFDTPVGDIRQAGAIDSARVGIPGIRQTPVVRTQGSDTSAFGSLTIQRDVPRIYPPPIDSTAAVGTPEYVRWRRFIDVTGIAEPQWSLGDGRVRLLGGYNPPPAVNVILNWLDEPYSVPPAANVILEFGALGSGRILGATLFDQLEFGTPTFTQPLGARPSGIASTLAFGSHNVSLFVDNLRPTGWNSQVFGTAVLTQVAQGISVGGIAPPPQTGPNGERQIPSPFVDFRIRYLTPGGIAVPTNQIANTHVVAFDIQFIDLAGRGPNPWVTGNARIEYAVRYIEPPFIASNIFGSHNVARIQVVAPTGWESSFISENHEFDINLQRALHHSGAADPTAYGDTHVRNQFEVVSPTGWLSGELNFPVAFNFIQHVAVSPFMGTNSDPTQWPSFSPSVENQIRTLGASGWQSSRFSVIGNIIENAADPIQPPGLEATLWGAETFAAYRIRGVAPEGAEFFHSSGFTIVRNAADVLSPSGWESSAPGTPVQVLALNRTVKHVLPYDGEVFGTAFAAPRVRSIFQRVFNDVPSGFPEVRLNPHPVAPSGIPVPQFGGHTVFEHFTIAFPRSTNVHLVPWVGEPIIANRNRALLVFPSDQSVYGLARVQNFNTHLTISAGDMTAWGAHFIGRRTRSVAAAPVSIPIFSVVHQIRNVIPDPPARQLVAPGSIVLGSEINPGIVPAPQTGLPTIYPVGISSEGYGSAVLTRNAIEPRSIVDIAQVGTPAFIAPQTVTARIIPWPNIGGTKEKPRSSSDLNWAKPRVSPHTVYAPAADRATSQAIENHPLNGPHAIDAKGQDGAWSLGGGHPWFGRPDISNQFRKIGPPVSTLGERHGQHTVELRRRFVFPQPLRSLRTGLPMFLNVPQFISFTRLGGFDAACYGEHAFAYAPVRTMPEPQGYDAALFGAAGVELKNRAVALQGIPHRGNPQEGLTNPWGLPLVGFPRVFSWGGYDMTLWGTAWVSHKNRALPVEGWSSLSLDDEDLGSFANRMRVFRRFPPGGVVGIPSQAVVGQPAIGSAIRGILGRGVSSYNSGEHAVKAITAILLTGWDSLEIGDIDRWEAGKVKASGDYLGAVGTPRMLHTLRPSGPASGYTPAPRVGVPLYAVGIPEVGFMGPSISNPTGCTNRVVTPLPILSQQNVPQPVMS